MEVAEHNCQIIGNRFLLDIPEKMAVIVHRRYTDEENARLREEWLACGERGGVLVSAAISPKEKEVLREAMNRGYNIHGKRRNRFAHGCELPDFSGRLLHIMEIMVCTVK